jgi:aminopeptidase N
MRNRLLLLPLLIFGVLAAARAAEPPLRYPPDRPIDVLSEKLDLDLDIVGRAITGTATIAFAANQAPLESVELDAVDLQVSAVREASRGGRALAFRTTGEKLFVTLAEPLPEGATATIEIDYCARPDEGLYFFQPSADDPETPLQVWSQSESTWARRWFPCVDTPEERQATEVIVRAPAGLEVISNGTLVSKDAPDGPGGKVRWHWKEDFPHPAYLVSIVAGKFAVWKDEWRGISLFAYVPPDRAADAERSFGETKRMLDYFSERFGIAYPYAKYAQVCVEQFMHGGMENISATTLNDATLHDERAHLDFSSDSLVAHELAHQWWGDLITCRDWAHIWLNEGFASYFEACWDEAKNGEDEYDYNMFEKARGAIEGGKDLPLVRRRYDDPDETFGGGTYPKGAWVLHMLRRTLGEEAFWRGLRAYAAEFRGKAVETADLRRAFERATSRSLGRFFDQWTERPGHPILDVAVSWSEKERLLEVEVKQNGPGDPFDFTAELAVVSGAPLQAGAPPSRESSAGAKGAAVAALRRSFPLHVSEKEQRFLIALDARPRWVRFDDREAVLKEVLAALAEEPRAIARIEAARALARDPSHEVVEALGKQLLCEPFWGAAAEIATILGKLSGERARDALLAATGIAHPKARRAVIEALGSFYGDPKVADALFALAKKGDPSVFVEAEIGESLAKTRDPRAFEVLARMLEKPSSREVLRTSALSGLTDLPDLRGLPLARERAKRGNRREVRAAAIGAIGKLAARRECNDAMRNELSEEVAGYLGEKNPWIRHAAVAALRDMGAEGAIPALEALSAHDPRERVREAAREAVEKIRSRKPADAELARLRDEVKKQSEEARALRERLERLEARGEEGKVQRGPGAGR